MVWSSRKLMEIAEWCCSQGGPPVARSTGREGPCLRGLSCVEGPGLTRTSGHARAGPLKIGQTWGKRQAGREGIKEEDKDPLRGFTELTDLV